MKKIVTIALGMAVAFTAMAQNWQDALLFSENNYSGTARSVAMGNAVTAIGGDPGSLVFNPAGGAVSSYSQFFFSPGLTYSVMRSQGTILSGDTDPIGLGDKVRTGYTRMKLPSAGFVFNMDTGRRNGWKRYSFGFLAHSTGNFTGRLNGAGVNYDNSYAASLATWADGYTTAQLGNSDWFSPGPSWASMTGFKSGMINSVNGTDNAYVAVTEVMDGSGNIRLAAPLYQKYGQQTTGSKVDMLFSFSANYDDVLYLGVNLGVTNLSYSMNEYWYEEPYDPAEFPAINYSDGTSATLNSLIMKRAYEASGAGIYLKGGVLWRPVAGLRVGAAFQTPMLLDITERYHYTGSTSLSGKTTAAVSSAEDEWGYTLRNPFRMNFGVAYSFGAFAVVSADYEFANLGNSRFRSRERYGASDFDSVNADISEFLGPQHQLRVGVEVKPLPVLAVRGGFGYTGSAETVPQGADYWQNRFSLAKTNASLGLGYSSGGSFYADAAVRLRFVPKEYLIPYEYADPNILTPEIEVKSTLMDAMITLGWRF